MAYMRQPSSDVAGANYIRVLVDGLGTNQISELIIHCSDGQRYNATIEGGTTGNYRSTTQTFTGLVSGRSYEFWATGRTTGGTAINVARSSFPTIYVPPPDPDPFISSLSIDGKGRIIVSWSVGNSNYMRSSNTFRIYLSGANNSSQYDMGYRDYYTRSFESSLAGNGVALVANSTYTVWVYVYDTDGNSFGASTSVVLTKPKPLDFKWDNNKTKDGIYNLTATEWSSFLDKINEFRAWVVPALTSRTFNKTVVPGSLGYIEPTAASFNAARNAINEMNVLYATPPAVSPNQIITAAALNSMVTALNSIRQS